MVMAVFMDEVVDEVQIVPIKTVDEGQTGPMPITETHDAFRLERNDSGGEQCEDPMSLGPGLPDGSPRLTDSPHLFEIGSNDAPWLPVLCIEQRRSYGHRLWRPL